MKQYRITTQNIPHNDDNDCFMSPDDPMYALEARGFLNRSRRRATSSAV